jgi:hypothetical protein
MKLKIIMITDIQVASAPNLSVENSIFNFGDVNFPKDFILAGGSWTTMDEFPDNLLKRILRYIIVIKNIQTELSRYATWLLIGDSAWQKDSRIVRYHRLWGALKAKDIEIPPSDSSHEIQLESNGRLKYFGALRISQFSVESIAQILMRERCAYLVMVPENLEFIHEISDGWTGDLNEDFSLMVNISAIDGLLFKKFGEFDDREWGILAFGKSHLIESLINTNNKHKKLLD